MREAYRQVLHVLVKPLGALLAEELQAKLHPSAALSFDALRAGDIQGTCPSILQARWSRPGSTPQSAAAIVGFDGVEVAEVPA